MTRSGFINRDSNTEIPSTCNVLMWIVVGGEIYDRLCQVWEETFVLMVELDGTHHDVVLSVDADILNWVI